MLIEAIGAAPAAREGRLPPRKPLRGRGRPEAPEGVWRVVGHARSLTGGAQHAPQVLLAPAGTPKRAPQGAFAPKDEGHCPAVSRPAVVSVQVSAQCTDGLTPELNLVGLGEILLGRE